MGSIEIFFTFIWVFPRCGCWVEHICCIWFKQCRQ